MWSAAERAIEDRLSAWLALFSALAEAERQAADFSK
jgi:hypothetical protein